MSSQYILVIILFNSALFILLKKKVIILYSFAYIASLLLQTLDNTGATYCYLLFILYHANLGYFL